MRPAPLDTVFGKDGGSFKDDDREEVNARRVLFTLSARQIEERPDHRYKSARSPEKLANSIVSLYRTDFLSSTDNVVRYIFTILRPQIYSWPE